MAEYIQRSKLTSLLRTILTTLAVCLVAYTALAATVDTTGGAVLNVDNPANTYIGNGTLQVSDDGSGLIELATANSIGTTNFEMTGGTISIDNGVTLRNGGWQKGVWTNNKAALNVLGTIDLWDGNAVTVDALTGNGTVTHTTHGGSQTLTVGNNNSSGTFTGVITETSGHTVGLNKIGTGTQTLTGANSYSGGTTITSGVLAIGQNNGGVNGDNINPDGTSTSLGSGTVNVAAGASLHINTAGLNIANNITLNGLSYGTNSGGPVATNNGPWNGAIMGDSKSGINSNTLSGTVTLNATSNVSTNWNDKTLIFAGQVTGAGGLVIDNSAPANRRGSIIQLNNPLNDYQGDTVVNAGNTRDAVPAQPTLQMGAENVLPSGAGKGNVVVNGNLDLRGFSQQINGLSGSGVIRAGSGTPTLTFGNNNANNFVFSGTITDGGGILALTKTGTGIQTLDGTSNTYSGGTTINGGFLRVQSDASLGATSGTVTLRDGGVLQNNNSTVNLDANRMINLANGEGRIRAGWSNKNITVNGQITGPGDLRIVNDSSQVFLTNSNNDYTGNTIIGGDGSNGGTGGLARLTLGASQVIPNGAGNGNVVFDAGGTNTGILNLNGFDESINGLSVASGSGIVENTTGNATLRVGRGAASSVYSGILRDNGGVLALEKVNAGTLELSGNNTYSGGTTVAGGLLRASENTIGSGNLTLTDGGIFFNVSGNGGGAYFDNDFGRTVTLDSGGGGFRSGWGPMTISGQITGVGGLTIVNDGTVTLTNTSNDYQGETTIGADGSGDNAVLRLGASGVLPDANTVTFSPTAGGTATLDLNGQSETVANINATGAGLNGNGAITNSSGTAATLNVTGQITNNTFSVGGTGDITINGSINGNNRLTKVNGNTVSLAGTADNVSLQGTVSGGVLELAKTSNSSVHALGGGTHIVDNGGTLRLAGTGNDQIFNGSTLTINGGGVFDLNGRNERVNTINIDGTGGGNGAVTNSSATASTLTGTIANTGASIGGTGNITINGSVNGGTLTKVNGNTVSLAGADDNVGLLLNAQAGRVELNKASNGGVHAVGGISDIAPGAVVQLTGTGGDQIFNGNNNTAFGGVNMSGGILALGGLSETIAELTGTGTVQNLTGTSTLTVGNFNRSSAFDGTIKGANDTALVLQKIGNGTFSIGGSDDNSFLTASVQGGVLELGKNSNGSVHAVAGITDIATGATVKLTGTGGDQIYAALTTANRGLVNMSGGTLDLNSRSESIAELTGTGTVTNNGGGTSILTVGQVNANSQYDGAIQDGTGIVGLTKIGNGVFTTTGTNAYSGLTNANDGILVVDGTHNGAGNYLVASGATLGGDGTINLAAGNSIEVSNNPGTVSPGNAGSSYTGPDPTYSMGTDSATVGTLTVNASAPDALALSMGGILQIDLLSPTEHDLLDIAMGTVSIGGVNPTTLEINGETDLTQIDFRGLGFVYGDRVDFLTADEIVGNFDSFAANQHFNPIGGGNFVLGNDGTSLFIAAVPEPTSIAIWTLLGLIFAGYGWRRMRH